MNNLTKQKILEFFKKHKYAFIVLVGALVISFVLIGSVSIYDDFKCPNEYATNEEYLDSIDKWTDDELLKNPEATEDELFDKRTKLFAKHNCEKGNWVSRDELENTKLWESIRY